MNIALDRLVEAIVATLRTDVIPNISDPYARGQAVGVIDLLNNIAPRIEWAQAPIASSIAEKRELLRKVYSLVGQPHAEQADEAPADTAAELMAQKDLLDARIGDAIAAIQAMSGVDDESRQSALDLVRRHLHDELTREMKLTRKPLFAEIASGGDGKGPQ